MTVPNSELPAAGTQQAMHPAQSQAERDHAVIAALNARIRQLEERAVEETPTAQNYGGPSVA